MEHLRINFNTLYLLRCAHFTHKVCFEYRLIWRLLRECARARLAYSSPQLIIVSNNIVLSCGIMWIREVFPPDLILLCFLVFKFGHFGPKIMYCGRWILFGICDLVLCLDILELPAGLLTPKSNILLNIK
jgi:hypothetical protein